ncbi:UNVERIFIED_CONTAM: hypothetical protein Q9R58_08305 [Methylobacteriaceae bacterium AG10]|nr:hypothetical protein [Methylobacteriaceae bacterium AG10]
MSVPNRVVPKEPPSEADRRRLARERALLAAARDSVAQGRVVPDSEVDAWLDRLVEGDEPLPIPAGRAPNDRS